MKLFLALFIILDSVFIILPPGAGAICPVCTVAVAGGLGLSRWLGIDDTISGLWVGGLLLSSSLWLSDWFAKQPRFKSKFKLAKKYLDLLVVVLMSLLILLPLTYTGIIGHPYNRLWGIDKLIFGTILGSGGFLLGVWLDQKVRKIKGKQLFKYQKVVFPVGVLVIISLVIYFLIS